ncbi:MAG TPA: hypothetical protein VJS44_18645 [Pyrinomonadaceae bacterium]|nr:hypothetical protein [Pyrinomonadaceae bacterium]
MVTIESYSDVFAQLERSHCRYVIVSGVAVVLHGHVRPIADLDLVIDLKDENKVMQSLAALGFVPSLPLPLSLLTVLRLFDQSQREIDVFARYRVPFDELWVGSKIVSIGNIVSRVISLEHLLLVKSKHGRPHDLLDIEALKGLHQ